MFQLFVPYGVVSLLLSYQPFVKAPKIGYHTTFPAAKVCEFASKVISAIEYHSKEQPFDLESR